MKKTAQQEKLKAEAAMKTAVTAAVTKSGMANKVQSIEKNLHNAIVNDEDVQK